DGKLALVHGCTCSTTLGRWHSGYHGFEPKLTNELGLSCSQNCNPSPAVQIGRMPTAGAGTKLGPISTVTILSGAENRRTD
ncbi:hypothetical protein, partial [Shewanella algae]|uniref:hypothetical protein n=1 Tax=Shewanella algae TaxID=38313 RepID=UPI001C92AEDA